MEQPPPAQAPSVLHAQNTRLLHSSCLSSCDHSPHGARTDDGGSALPMREGNIPEPPERAEHVLGPRGIHCFGRALTHPHGAEGISPT